MKYSTFFVVPFPLKNLEKLDSFSSNKFLSQTLYIFWFPIKFSISYHKENVSWNWRFHEIFVILYFYKVWKMLAIAELFSRALRDVTCPYSLSRGRGHVATLGRLSKICFDFWTRTRKSALFNKRREFSNQQSSNIATIRY